MTPVPGDPNLTALWMQSELIYGSACNWQVVGVQVEQNRCKDRALKKAMVKGKGLDTCYSATYMSQAGDQQRFTISEVAAYWHEPMVPQRIMWLQCGSNRPLARAMARANGRLDPRCS